RTGFLIVRSTVFQGPGVRRTHKPQYAFPRWADVADQTPQALLLRPKLGASAVEALIEAARDAVRINQDAIAAGKVGAEAAVARLVGQLDDFDRAILSARVWAPHPQSQRVL